MSIVYASNNSLRVHNNYLLQKLPKCTFANSLAMLEAIPYFEGSSLILAPNLSQEKCFFCVLVCCTDSAVYLAGRHVKESQRLDLDFEDSTLQSAFLAPKPAKFIQILLNVYTKQHISLRANLANSVQ